MSQPEDANPNPHCEVVLSSSSDPPMHTDRLTGYLERGYTVKHLAMAATQYRTHMVVVLEPPLFRALDGQHPPVVR